MTISVHNKSIVARAIPFDNSINGFIATDAQAAIEESKQSAFGNDSDKLQFARQGSLSNNQPLLTINNIASSSSPDTMAFNVLIRRISFSCSSSAAPFDLKIWTRSPSGINTEIYEHTWSGQSGYYPLVGEIGVQIQAGYGVYVTAHDVGNPKPSDVNFIITVRQY